MIENGELGIKIAKNGFFNFYNFINFFKSSLKQETLESHLSLRSTVIIKSSISD